MAYVKLEDVLDIIRNENWNFAGLIKHIEEHCPVADVAEVKHGEWVLSKTNPYDAPNVANRTLKICSCCGWTNACRYAYCPNCGAKMEGGKAE